MLRENPQGQTVYVYGSEGHNVLGEYQPPGTSSIRSPNNLVQFTAISQSLFQRNASGAWVAESVPHTAAYDALGRLTSFSAAGSSALLKRALT